MKKTLFLAGAAIFLSSCSTTDFLADLSQSSNSSSSPSSSASKTVEKFSISVSGTPSFEIPNVFFAGETAASRGLTVTASYPNGTTKDVSAIAVFAVSNSGAATVRVSDGGAEQTGTVPGNYYVAAKDALTRKPAKISTTKITRDGKEYSFDQYKFGDFPQTVVSTTSTLKFSDSAVYNGYHLGSDGYFYEKCNENPYKSDYKYSNGTQIGKEVRFFKVEPIVWRLQTSNYEGSGNALLLAEKALAGGIPFYPARKQHSIGGKQIRANNYRYSTVRAYLNGRYESDDDQAKTYDGNGFLQKAFSKDAQNLISAAKINNSALKNGSSDSSRYCEDTTDKVFLLSFDEIYFPEYGFSEKNYGSVVNKNKIGDGNLRARNTTDYARANGTIVYYGKTSWWLRSPQTDYTFDLTKDEEGCQAWVIDTSDNDTYARMADSAVYGIVPAIAIKL